jgi:hypothetical protein
MFVSLQTALLNLGFCKLEKAESGEEICWGTSSWSDFPAWF